MKAPVPSAAWEILGECWEAAGLTEPGHTINEDALVVYVNPRACRLGILDEISAKSGIPPTIAGKLVKLAVRPQADQALSVVEALTWADQALFQYLKDKGARTGVCAVLADIKPVAGNRLNVEVASVGDCTVALMRQRAWLGRRRLTPVVLPHLDDLGALISCLGQEKPCAVRGAKVILKSGETLLLASDGLLDPRLKPWNWAGEHLLSDLPLGAIASNLLSEARRQGSTDDATVILVRLRNT